MIIDFINFIRGDFVMNNAKYPIRLNLFINEEMDDSLDEISQLMGITKHEYIRFIIGQSLAGHREAVQFMKEKVQ